MRKICLKCKKSKEIKNFKKGSKNKKGKQCYINTCKDCLKKQRREYRQSFSEDKHLELRKRKKRERDKRNLKYPEKLIWTRAKNRSTSKGIPFNIEIKDIIIPKFCPILGIKLERKFNKLHSGSPSIDKINNKKGYIKGNIAIISYKANGMKGDMDLAQVKKLYLYIKNNGNI